MTTSNRAILFLTSWYPVNSNPSHGIFVRNHAIALSHFQTVIVVYAYACAEGPYFKVEHKNVNENLTEYIVKYPKSSGVLKFLNSFLNYKKAHRILIEHLLQKKTKVKALQVNVIFPASVVLSLYKKLFRVKHTVVEHWSGYLPDDGSYKGSILKHFTKKCISGASKIWHVSHYQKAAMNMAGLKGNYELLYNAVNVKTFPLSNWKPERIKLLHVSSLVEKEKNISGTFRVFKKLQDQNLDFDIVMAGGDGNELSSAKKLAEQLKLKNISFTGNLPPEKISELMQKSSALVLFSNYEGMPVVALEALSCGLPVFCTKVGQLPFLIREDYGVSVEKDNEEQMVESLKKLFNKEYNFDSAAMHEFVVKNASYEAVGKQMNEFYKG
ncbi:MAG: glycosyltransferase [Bacteroidia bacterium]|nr:glycosyltransferase [Bacteroidia bacterium]